MLRVERPVPAVLRPLGEKPIPIGSRLAKECHPEWTNIGNPFHLLSRSVTPLGPMVYSDLPIRNKAICSDNRPSAKIKSPPVIEMTIGRVQGLPMVSL